MSVNYFIRKFSRDVRVRFAPSPTGFLHLGGLRTALYNYLFAKSQKGKFILRIEDTDRTRLVPQAVEQLELDLKWVGLVPDEGPSSPGPHAPYIQSERSELYREFAQKLLSVGAAYYCFCSERRLELLRKDALRSRQVPKYDNHCRHLDQKEIEEKKEAGVAYCIRFKLVPSEPFDDLVYGKCLHEVEQVEGDPVILKADGWPTYHLANVVDDHLMNISHVIRGVEWLQSTNKHLMIYRALGYEPPCYAHLPLLMNSDGTKLSKRQNDITVESMRKRGIFPRALLNYVIQAGGGFPNKISHTASMSDLISNFHIGAVNKSSGKLPTDRLLEFNRLELARRTEDEKEMVTLMEEAKNIIKNHYINKYNQDDLDLSDEHIRSILVWCLPRISCLEDLVSKNMEFLWVMPRVEELGKLKSSLLENLINELSGIDFKKENLLPALRSYSEKNNIPFKELTKLLRFALTGLKEGPGVAEMLEILGKPTSLKRLERAKQIMFE